MALAELFSDTIRLERLFPREPMSRHTSFKIGGPAELLVMPEDAGQAAGVLSVCRLEGVPCFVMGKGSNLLVGDGGIDGVVLKLANGFDRVNVQTDGTVTADSGVSLARLASRAQEAGLTGLEFAHGIPGSLGGAVFMNAGAYGGEMKDVVTSMDVLTGDGSVETLTGEEMAFGYRSSVIQQTGGIVIKVRLTLSNGEPDAVLGKMRDLDARRKAKQPLEFPSAGSTFKRPPGYFAGKLVMDSGLAGFAVGGAQVSPKHCGFIVYTGGAAARDVLAVIEHVKRVVMNKFGVVLEPEVKLVGHF